ncbi:putative cytokinetic ring protein SteA [Spelaeicoccus albus]|uniref:Putative membrane-anchored protein n=1 Tax=Spelaeicoccus albus TaxID=1280376 RepID=A0A7Z0IJ31_9MICO|nr:putative cytokinetic ring protein SteA [Spelaeicoccus albus]NYI69094.1 putative membrane-anchored protein [Spelaeicoccus albus]
MLFRRTRIRALTPGDAVAAIGRVDKRTKDLTKRLEPGDIAIIDHRDIDRVSAESLVECKPSAVVNASKSISGRYPNLGPEILVAAGIPLIDDVGPEIMTAVTEGQRVNIDGPDIYADGKLAGTGTVETSELVAADMIEAEAGMSEVLESFVTNTIEYIRRERDLLLDRVGVPDVRTPIEGRQVLIVVRGYHYKEDLAMLRPYIREYRPVLVGVDGGADAIMDTGLKPDMIVGDMDSVSDTALTSGAELVVHAYRDGRAPGLERLDKLGVDCVVFPATGTSEDVAMLLADDKGASLIVAVGTHDTLIEFLDKGRKGMASTFLTRLRIGSKLIDAKGVSRLYRQRISNLQMTLLALAGIAALAVAIASTAGGQTFVGIILAYLDGVFSWIHNLFWSPSAG